MALPILALIAQGLSANNQQAQAKQAEQASGGGSLERILGARSDRMAAQQAIQPRTGMAGMDAMTQQNSVFEGILQKYGAGRGQWPRLQGGGAY